MIFQGAEHSRFCHSLGVAFLAKRIIDRLKEDPNLPTGLDFEEIRRTVLAGGLLHDIGHGPFSHLFERTFSQKSHEDWGLQIIEDSDTKVHKVLKENGLSDSVRKLLKKSFSPRFAIDIISSQFDADRLDYLLRDSYMTGVTYGRYDLEWLLEVIELANIPTNGLGLAVNRKKGFHAAEHFIIGRYLMYQQVYFHRTIRAAERMIKLIFERLVNIAKDGKFPGFCPDPMRQLLGSGSHSISLRAYLTLDDEFMYTCFNLWSEDGADEILKDLCSRILRRDIFKSEMIDLSRINDHLKYTADLKALQEAMKDAGFDPHYYLASDAAEDLPYKDMTWFVTKGKFPEDIWLAEDGIAKFNLSDPLVSPLIDSLRNTPIAATRLCFPLEVKEIVRKHLKPYLANRVSEDKSQLALGLSSLTKQAVGERS